MSDHGFETYTRSFSLNTWLLEEGYLVLKPAKEREKPRGAEGYRQVFLHEAVDWTRTRAYGVGFNGLYLNLRGRELDDPTPPWDDPETPDVDESKLPPVDESGIVAPEEAEALLREMAAKLEALTDPVTGRRVVRRADLARDVYTGPRLPEAPDILVGYEAGYGNSDASSTGRIPNAVLADNLGGTFNGNHLMAPDVVPGILMSNRGIRPGEHGLEDLTVEILQRYGIEPLEGQRGQPVLE
jgi:predicted AlkP superfamily phosphohydrolase/phosphomutase